MDYIEVAMAADAGYFPGMLVTAVTLAERTRSAVRFHLLDGGIPDDSIALLTAKVREVNPQSCVNRLRLADYHGRLSLPPKMYYARLALPELLPEVDHVLYCDVDFLWTLDCAELWALRGDDYVAAAVHDPSAADELEWIKNHCLITIDPDKHFNSGLMLMNLARLRQTDVMARALELMKNDPEALDQVLLNAILVGYGYPLRYLDTKWNEYASISANTRRDGFAFHFACITPWAIQRKTFLVPAVVDRWMACYARILGVSCREAVGRLMNPTRYALGLWLRRLGHYLPPLGWAMELAYWMVCRSFNRMPGMMMAR